MPNPIFFQLKIRFAEPYNKTRKSGKGLPQGRFGAVSAKNTKYRIRGCEAERMQVADMFFKKSKKEEKKELLYRENVLVGCEPDTKENIIRRAGQMLVDSGYVNQPYVDGMVEREKTFSTFMGNGLALPHGVEGVKKEIKASGISVMTFKESVDWDGEEVQVVIGIAGVGEEHMDILSSIAEKMLDDDTAEQVKTCDADTLYKILSGKE